MANVTGLILLVELIRDGAAMRQEGLEVQREPLICPFRRAIIVRLCTTVNTKQVEVFKALPT